MKRFYLGSYPMPDGGRANVWLYIWRNGSRLLAGRGRQGFTAIPPEWRATVWPEVMAAARIVQTGRSTFYCPVCQT